MAEEPTTPPPDLNKREPEQAGSTFSPSSSVDSNIPKGELQFTPSSITSKLRGPDFSSDGVTNDEDPTTPPPSLSEQDSEQAGSTISARGSVSSNIVIQQKAKTATPSTQNSVVGFNNTDDEYEQHSVSNDDLSTKIANLNLTDGVTGVTKQAQKVNSIDLEESECTVYTDGYSQALAAENESSCSRVASMGILLKKEFDDNGNFHFVRQSFPLGPSQEAIRKEEEELRKLKEDKGIANDDSIVKSLEKFKEEYLRTKPTYPSLKQLRRNNLRGYKDLWQVKDMPKKSVCRKIERLYHILRKQKNRGDGYRFELRLEKEIVYVPELECYMLNGERNYRCEYDKVKTRSVFVRMDVLLCLIYNLLNKEMTVNIRWIPYTWSEIFNDTDDVEYVLDRICKHIGCSRDNINIFASAKGRIAGDISFKATTETYCQGGSTYCQGGADIEPRTVAEELEFTTLSKQELLLILVVEKETIFQRLLEDKIHKRFRCIIITGCGVPTVATRTLLNKVQAYYDLPAVSLVDHNAGGFNIYLNYLCGSKNMSYNSLNLRTPGIKWLGLSPSDLIEHNIEAIENENVQGLETIMNNDFVKKSQELVKEVGKIKYKVDIEGMMSKNAKYFTEIFVPLKFKRLGDGRTYK